MNNFGPVMLDVEGFELTAEDEGLIASDLCGGLILFTRNFASFTQVHELCLSIKAVNPNIIIAVDQEGGRVQRFQEEFTKLPALSCLGELYKAQPELALEKASDLGELMALEVQSVGCDISFAPVLDLGNMTSQVIGDRAFSTDIAEIIALAEAYINGMNKAGMAATGKHFPGHGSVVADSHVDIPYDHRSFTEIEALDLVPFKSLKNQLAAIMPAHIIFSQVDPNPAGFSSLWVETILRQQIGFEGVVFSDDLTMQGASAVGGYTERAHHALNAGCDMVLVCNNRQATLEVMQSLKTFTLNSQSSHRLEKLVMQNTPLGLPQLKQTDRWQALSESISLLLNE